MRRRVMELVGPAAERMWVSTFHSACVRILRAHGERLGYKGSFTIYDDADSRRLVEIVCRDLDIDAKKLSPRSILGQISQAKSAQQGPAEYRTAALTIFDRRVADVFDEYQQRLLAANAMDFDDLLLNTVRLFQRPPRRPRALPGPVHPRPRRRVPGHQRGAERDGRPAGRRAPQHRRGRRQRPVRLPVPGCRHPQHPRIRAGLPRRHRRHPRPELPLHPDHPRRRQRGDRQQRLAQAQDAVDRCRRGRADHPLPGRGRVRRGRVGRPRDRPASTTTASAGATWPSSTGPTPRAVPSRRRWSRPRFPTRWSGAPGSTTGARSRTCSPTSGCWSIPTTR